MRFVNRPRLLSLLAATALVAAIPVMSQDSPESILPPGFGDPVEDPKPSPRPRQDEPDDLLPPSIDDSGGDTGGAPNSARAPRPRSASSDDFGGGSFELPSLVSVEGKDGKESEEGDETAAPAVLQDLPPQSRRSIDQVGILAADDGDMGPNAYGSAPGVYLTNLMHSTEAPIASRWASITLRRALLSHTLTPKGMNGADFAAERAWLLLRMGEADAARMLVQAVDADQYTPWMKSIVMQSALASADPAGLCPASEGHPLAGKDGYWMMARAICAAFSGESSLASALVDKVQDDDKAPRIDALLAEKVVGATANTRRAVNVLWEDTKTLTAWRFGLATATAIKIPENLMASVGPHVRAWRARAPLLLAGERTADVEVAAALGVYSSTALVDHYSLVAQEAADAGSAGNAAVDSVGTAYGAPTAAARLAAMKSLWAADGKNPFVLYAHQLATARAAAMIAPSDQNSAEADGLISAMFSAGLDVQAARWSKIVSSGSLGWALLAVGSPEKPGSVSNGSISGFEPGDSGRRAQFLFAGLAGLGRIEASDVASLAEDMGVPISRKTAWSKAMDRAANAREPATVALLASIGLQAKSWRNVAPAQLYHAVSGLRRAGLEAEARMIAAEALMRS